MKRLTPTENSSIKYVKFSSKKIYLQYKETSYYKLLKFFQIPPGALVKM